MPSIERRAGAVLFALILLGTGLLSGCRTFQSRAPAERPPAVGVLVQPGEPYGDNLLLRLRSTTDLSKPRVFKALPGVEGEDRLRVLAESCRVVVVGSPGFDDDLAIVAPDFPETAFVSLHGVVEGDNVANVRFNLTGGYQLAGAYAAVATRSPVPGMNAKPVIGFIGRKNSQVEFRVERAFRQGARAIDPRVRVMAVYLETRRKDKVVWKSVSGAVAELGASGADILAFTDPTLAVSVANLGSGAPMYLIGAGLDQSPAAPGRFMVSVIPHPEAVIRGVRNEVRDEVFTGGIRRLGLAQGAVGITALRGLTPREREFFGSAAIDPQVKNQLIARILVMRRSLPLNTGRRLENILNQIRDQESRHPDRD